MDRTDFYIDDITWNDLSMEQVYEKINTSRSSVGQEYLKKILRKTMLSEELLAERSARADFFAVEEKTRLGYQKIFKALGKTKKLSLYDYIFRFHELKQKGNGLHYLLILLMIAAIVLIFIRPVIGIIALVVMFVINIATYFRSKAEIESYFMCFKYIVRMIQAGNKILKTGIPENAGAASAGVGAGSSSPGTTAGSSSEFRKKSMEKLLQNLSEEVETLSPLKRGSWLLTNSISGSLVDVIMDYVRMLFHVDIIRFYSMLKMAADKTEMIDRLFCTLGELEADICICEYRASLTGWCRPVFKGKGSSEPGKAQDLACEEGIPGNSSPEPSKAQDLASKKGFPGEQGREDKPCRLSVKGMYHPLTPEPVKNDLAAANSVLLTGSNASGKSTFLKMTAINQILAQTIYTALADTFQTEFYKVLSSMALSDNILGGESYFIVEIKSLKRIMDAIEEPGTPVMCFIDEVLRGTNTKERVAASSQILKTMAKTDALCFAATHDIELTQLLKEVMDNYHFEEFVEGNDVRFDYKLKTGPATTRNAIRLMKAYGFDSSITEAADRLAGEL